jgi:hypothetical protein
MLKVLGVLRISIIVKTIDSTNGGSKDRRRPKNLNIQLGRDEGNGKEPGMNQGSRKETLRCGLLEDKREVAARSGQLNQVVGWSFGLVTKVSHWHEQHGHH